MQQWYTCPRCGQYVQYGQLQCYNCGYQMYWQPVIPVQPPAPGLINKLKSILRITARTAPTSQYNVPMQPPPYMQQPAPFQPPATMQAPASVQDTSSVQPVTPVAPLPTMQPSVPVQDISSMQAPTPIQPSAPVQTSPTMQAPTPIQNMQPPVPLQPLATMQAPAPVPDASSVQPAAPVQPPPIIQPYVIIQPPSSRQAQQQLTPRQEPAGNVPQDRRNLKNTLTAYLYWLCLGSHYLYLENMRTQVIFWLTLGGLGIWWLIDMLRLPGMVNDRNIDQLLNAVLKAEAINKQKSSKDNQPQ